jgi:transcriptional regulator with XRE-family HTH domain
MSCSPSIEKRVGWAKALQHPLRARILELLLDAQTCSPTEMAQALGVSLGVVSYHVRYLADNGILVLARRTPVRGALKHEYRLARRDAVALALGYGDELDRLSTRADAERDRLDLIRRRRLGEAIARHREAAGLDERELSARVGLSLASLARIEEGTSDPTYTLLCRIADVFGVGVGALLTEAMGRPSERVRSPLPVAIKGADRVPRVEFIGGPLDRQQREIEGSPTRFQHETVVDEGDDEPVAHNAHTPEVVIEQHVYMREHAPAGHACDFIYRYVGEQSGPVG